MQLISQPGVHSAFSFFLKNFVSMLAFAKLSPQKPDCIGAYMWMHVEHLPYKSLCFGYK